MTRVLERLIAEHGCPEAVRPDNRPEFTSRRMLAWAEDHRISLVHIQPGRPMQSGHVESFRGRLRDECLNTTWFRILDHVRNTLEAWRMEYNESFENHALQAYAQLHFTDAAIGIDSASLIPTGSNFADWKFKTHSWM